MDVYMSEKLAGMHLVAPSVLGIGEPFSLRVRLLTEPFLAKAVWYGKTPSVNSRFNASPRGTRYMENVPPRWEGSVTIDGGKGYSGPESFPFAGGPGPYPGDKRPIRTIEGMSFSTPGTKFITVQDPVSGVAGRSNPIRVTAQPPVERLFWGDIHCHSFFSHGLRCPEELYAFARDEAFLDIFALTEHSEEITDRQWNYFTGVTNDFYDPGRFVTLVAFEWTSREWGHRNVYYRDRSGPLMSCTDPVYGQLSKLYQVASEKDALVIPHHSANAVMGVNWSLGHNPEVERLVEIYSIWGNSERARADGNPRPIRFAGGEKSGQHVLDALAMGRRYGFTAGGDTHDGRPGDDLHNLQKNIKEYPKLHRQGIMGVWTTGLTREAVFDALWNRRVFATTNVRIFLKFSINGHPMGSEFTPEGDLSITVEAASENPIARVDLVRNGEDVRVFAPHRRDVVLRVKETHPEMAVWYYARLTREDGHMAWSSPIWVKGT